MSKCLCGVLLSLAPLMLVLPAGATDLLPDEYSYPPEGSGPYENSYNDRADLPPDENGYRREPYVDWQSHTGDPDPAYERPYGRSPYLDYPAYERRDYRDLARYCQPDGWAVANGYLPPQWCFPEPRERAGAPLGVAPPSPYRRGYVSRRRAIDAPSEGGGVRSLGMDLGSHCERPARRRVSLVGFSLGS
jgi:hypothetical protein